MTVNGRTMGENRREVAKPDGDVIWSYDKPPVKDAGFLVLRGNLFDRDHETSDLEELATAIWSTLKDPNAFEGRAIVFEARRTITTGSTIPRSGSTSTACCLFAAPDRSATGGAEVVNMLPAAIKRGILSLPCIGDAGNPAPQARPRSSTPAEAAADGGLAVLKTGDRSASTSTKAQPHPSWMRN
jgi:dihydroxy-acid dehydratase